MEAEELSPHRRLAILFGLGVLAPAFVLGLLGLRALSSDRLRAEALLRREREEALRNLSDHVREQLEADRALLAATLDEVRDCTGKLERAMAAGVLVAATPQELCFLTQGYVRATTAAATVEPPLPETVAELRALAANEDDDVRAAALFRLGRLELELGRYDRAVESFELLLSNWPQPTRESSAHQRMMAALRLAELADEGKPNPTPVAAIVSAYRALIVDHWIIDAERVRFYASELEKRLDAWCDRDDNGACADYRQLRADRSQRIGAIEGLERWVHGLEPTLTAWARGTVATPELTFQPAGAPHLRGLAALGDDGVVLAWVIDESILARRLLKTLRLGDDIDIDVRSESGSVLYQSYEGGTPETASNELVLGRGMPPWTIRAFHRPGSLASTQRDLYVVLTLLLALVLGLGALLSWRTVQREAEGARVRAELVSLVSHEFKSPIASMRALVDRLARPDVGESARGDYLKIVRGELLRLTRLVNNLLDYRGIESGMKRYRLVETDLGGLVRDVAAEFEFRAAPMGFRLEVDIDEILPTVRIDRDAVTQAMLNLLDNAMKFSDDEKWIGVKCGREGDGVVVEISDRGAGFPTSSPQDGRVADSRGLGLGLTVVRHVAEAHGAALTSRSIEGKGTRFSIRFPLESEPARDGQAESSDRG